MPQARVAAGFAVRFVLVYVVALLAWPLLARPYASFFAWEMNLVFESKEPDRQVRFRPLDEPAVEGAEWELDTELRVSTRQLWNALGVSSRYMGYVPTVIVLALTLATPVGWRRKARALLIGFLLVNAFIALERAVQINVWFYQQAHPDLARESPELHELLRKLFGYASSMGPVYVVPVVIWVVATFRREDLARVSASLGSALEERSR